MGKRRPVIVVSSSSSENDEVRGSSADGGRGSSRSRSVPASQKKPRRGSSSRARNRMPSRASPKVEFDMLSEEFFECLNDFNMPGHICDSKDLWVDKYKPRILAELAVHKKKVQEVKIWLEQRINVPKQGFGDCTLVLVGQAGVGKSATIHAIATELGAELCEWTTPTPTLWQEHVHNVNSGLCYMSKLEEFENFVERIRKYSLLRSTTIEVSTKPTILVIDDIPVTNGRVSFTRLSKCLTGLVHWTQVPTVILITQFPKTEPRNTTASYWDDLENLLQKAGAQKVVFNPVTVYSIKKALLRVCKEEERDLTSEVIDQIAKSSGGDIRHAITSLQYYCLNVESFLESASPGSCNTFELCSSTLNKSVAMQRINDPNLAISFPFGREESLTLFHALGKFLHNKRETEIIVEDVNPNSFTLQKRLTRNPLKMDPPEKVLSQAHGQAHSVADFLYENALDFINDDAVYDAWLVTSYLSESDCLLASTLQSSSRRFMSEISELGSLAQQVAASVAVRGLLFGNSQPTLTRWHAIRGPRIWQIEQSLRSAKDHLLKDRFENLKVFGPWSLSDIATDLRPTMKWISSGKPFAVCADREQLQLADEAEDVTDRTNGEYVEGIIPGDSCEDDIEDW